MTMAETPTSRMTLPTHQLHGRVVTAAERRLAVEHWLLMATDDWQRARQEWRRDGVALLRCGGLFSAIRISAPVVHAAAGTDDPTAVDHYLAQVLLGGPVFTDRSNLRYYVLVGNSTGLRREWTLRRDDAEFMGRGHYVGVPAVDATSREVAGSYWCVEMASAGELAAPDVASQLVRIGRFRLARGEGACNG
ncbi:hypothetical protein ACIQB5_47875 [Streptomyces sp. NPDC088560]|uniref:hypothetical protein n=1 Tax=Streptomyces sp. NPDC088560 TaxID=3365868 RepID=UPI0037F9570D